MVMSQQDVEHLQALLEQWTSETWTLETWQSGEVDMSPFDPEVAYEDMNLPDHVGEIYHGREGVVRAAERWIEPFDWLHVELEQIVDEGDHLVSFHRWQAKARHTGIEIDEALIYRWTFRDGKVIHFCSIGPEEVPEAEALRA
jgi:ketosteroid isomerase-like protein